MVLLNLASFQGVKEHKCGICGREFTLLANMKRHVLIHTNIRAYQCHLCYKSFVQKQTLKAHMIVHSDVKPFKCKVSRGPEGMRRGRAQRVCVVSGGRLFATLCPVARQAPLSMEFFRQEYWSRLPFPTPGYLPDPGITPTSSESPAMAGRFCTPELPGNPGRAQRALQMRGEKSPGNLVLSLLRRASEAQRMSAARPRPSAVSPPHLCSAVPQELPCLSPCGIGQCAGPGSSQTRES